MNKRSTLSNVYVNDIGISRTYPQQVVSRLLLVVIITISGLGVTGDVACQAQGRSTRTVTSYKIINGRRILVDYQQYITDEKEGVGVWRNVSARYRPFIRSKQANAPKSRIRKTVPDINAYVSKLIGRTNSVACLVWLCEKKDVSDIQKKAQQFNCTSDMGTLHNLVINACLPIPQGTPINQQGPAKSIEISIVPRIRIRKQEIIERFGDPQKQSSTQFKRKEDPGISWLIYDYVAFAVNNQANCVVGVRIYCMEYLNSLALEQSGQ